MVLLLGENTFSSCSSSYYVIKVVEGNTHDDYDSTLHFEQDK